MLDSVRTAPRSLLQSPFVDREESTSPPHQSGMLTPQHHDFRRSIEASDEKRLRKLLGALEPGARYRLVNSPLPDSGPLSEPLPRLPLSRAAAQGDVGNMLALLNLGPAVGLLADEYAGGLQLTAAYWAAAYGQCEALEALDAQGCAPMSQAVLACHQGTYVGVLQWACAHGATSGHFREALEMAVEASPERLQDIDQLVQTAGAKLNIACTDMADRSLLYAAIDRGHLLSARRLLALGANPDFTPNVASGSHWDVSEEASSGSVVALAIERHHLDLLPLLFESGAQRHSQYLKTALAQPGDPTAAYIALMRCGVLPESDTEAAGLEKLCINGGQAHLAGLVSTQRIGLQLADRAEDSKERARLRCVNQERAELLAKALLDAQPGDGSFAEGVSLFVADASMGAVPKVASKQFRLAFGGKKPPIWGKLRQKVLPQKPDNADNEASSNALTLRSRGSKKR